MSHVTWRLSISDIYIYMYHNIWIYIIYIYTIYYLYICNIYIYLYLIIYMYIYIYLGPFRDPTEARTPRSELPAKNLMMSFVGRSFFGWKTMWQKDARRWSNAETLFFQTFLSKIYDSFMTKFSVPAFRFSLSIGKFYKFTEAVPSPPIKSSSLAFVEAVCSCIFQHWKLPNCVEQQK